MKSIVRWATVSVLMSSSVACSSPDDVGCTGGAVVVDNQCKCPAPLFRENGECVPDPRGYDASAGAAGAGDTWTSPDAGARDGSVGMDARALERDAAVDAAVDTAELDARTVPNGEDAATSLAPAGDSAVQSAQDAGAHDTVAQDAGAAAPAMPPVVTTPPVTTPPVTTPPAPACVPATEVCDKKDNDCDGTVDEGFMTGGSCTAGKGECLATGTLQCDASGALTCTAAPKPAAAAEVCRDGKDNDCDDMVDDGCPTCGNGIVESGEACDGDTWHCSPECKKRSIYTACDGASGALCDESTVACYENLCVPQVSNYDVASCPKVVGGYQVGITFAQGCVLSCNASSDCPPHLPRCMDNPFVDADPRETKRYCWRSF